MITLEDRQAFMRLPIEERRKIMAEQAERAMEDGMYNNLDPDTGLTEGEVYDDRSGMEKGKESNDSRA